MKQQPSPWSIKGIDTDARQLAKDAAQKAGMTLGEWMSVKIREEMSGTSGGTQQQNQPTASDKDRSSPQEASAQENRAPQRLTITASPPAQAQASAPTQDMTSVNKAIRDLVHRIMQNEEKNTAMLEGLRADMNNALKRTDTISSEFRALNQSLATDRADMQKMRVDLRQFGHTVTRLDSENADNMKTVQKIVSRTVAEQVKALPPARPDLDLVKNQTVEIQKAVKLAIEEHMQSLPKPEAQEGQKALQPDEIQSAVKQQINAYFAGLPKQVRDILSGQSAPQAQPVNQQVDPEEYRAVFTEVANHLEASQQWMAENKQMTKDAIQEITEHLSEISYKSDTTAKNFGHAISIISQRVDELTTEHMSLKNEAHNASVLNAELYRRLMDAEERLQDSQLSYEDDEDLDDPEDLSEESEDEQSVSLEEEEIDEDEQANEEQDVDYEEEEVHSQEEDDVEEDVRNLASDATDLKPQETGFETETDDQPSDEGTMNFLSGGDDRRSPQGGGSSQQSSNSPQTPYGRRKMDTVSNLRASSNPQWDKDQAAEDHMYSSYSERFEQSRTSADDEDPFPDTQKETIAHQDDDFLSDPNPKPQQSRLSAMSERLNTLVPDADPFEDESRTTSQSDVGTMASQLRERLNSHKQKNSKTGVGSSLFRHDNKSENEKKFNAAEIADTPEELSLLQSLTGTKKQREPEHLIIDDLAPDPYYDDEIEQEADNKSLIGRLGSIFGKREKSESFKETRQNDGYSYDDDYEEDAFDDMPYKQPGQSLRKDTYKKFMMTGMLLGSIAMGAAGYQFFS